MIIGLTGPTGSGKSTFAELARDMGFAVVDCDKEARSATESGSEGLVKLCIEFGNDILLPDGSLNRKQLAALAFATERDTERLNKTLLPVILKQIEERIAELKKQGFGKVLLDAPTLYESGADKLCDEVVAVLSDREIRKNRILSRDNLSQADAEIRLSASKPDSFYKDRTKHILYNNGQKQEFFKACNALLVKLTENI